MQEEETAAARRSTTNKRQSADGTPAPPFQHEQAATASDSEGCPGSSDGKAFSKRRRLASPTTPQSITPRDATGWIRGAAPGDGLLLVTCDASGGGSSSGICAVLRQLGGGRSSGSLGDNWSCGVATLPWDESTAGEIEAVSLGLRLAKARVPQHRGRDVLVVTDSSGAAQVLSSTKPSALVAADNARGALRELQEAGTMTVMVTEVRSTHGKEDGFFDHAAADVISAAARHQQHRELDAEEAVAVPRLGPEDLAWLGEPPVKRKAGGSSKRKARLKSRLQRECGISVD